MDDQHTERVSEIATAVKSFYKHKTPFRIFHGSTNATRTMSFKRSEMLDVSGLDHVLSIDAGRQVAIVEPNVPMDMLLKQTLAQGMLPPVVMEFPGITVGGGVQGGAGESSSWKWGCFNETCNSYEMVLADGRIIVASREQNSDLFYGTAGSYGSLGVITAAEIKLVPAQAYVTLTYLKVSSFDEAVQTLQDSVKSKKYDYIDGIMFANNRGVIVVGILSDSVAGPIRKFSRAFDEWFYLHADKISLRDTVTTETVPITDYLFRYDRGAFWTGRYAFERSGVPFNRFTRWLTDHIMHTRKLYQALQDSGAAQQYFIQDMAVPEDKAVEFMQYIDTSLATYPLWLCPMKPDKHSSLQSSNLKTKLAINVGIWSSTAFDSYDDFLATNRTVETELRKSGGKKWFYAQSYYSETEFWNIYDKTWYQKLRSKYAATSLPDVYEKTRAKDGRVINIRRAAFKTMFGIAKLHIKD